MVVSNNGDEEPDWESDSVDDDDNSGGASTGSDEGISEDDDDDGNSFDDHHDDDSARSSLGSEDDGSDDEEVDHGNNARSMDSNNVDNNDDDLDDVSFDESDDDSDDSDASKSSSSEFSVDGSVFRDEEANGMKRGMSGGDLMNEPEENNNSKSDLWMKCVPGCIIAFGTTAAAVFCCCLCFIPLIIIIIGLSVGLTSASVVSVAVESGENATDDLVDIIGGITDGLQDLEVTVLPTIIPTTLPPTERPLVPVTTLVASSDTTIYRDGLFQGSAYGDDTTMLVQNGPPGDPEIASAYSLVQFDGIQGINSDTMSIDTYFTDSIDGLSFQFCLNHATSSNPDDADASDASLTPTVRTYSTCLLPSANTTTTDIETLTGDTAPDYRIPDSCYNGKTVTFEVLPSTTNTCIDVTSLFFETSSTDTGELPPITRRTTTTTSKRKTNPNLRGRHLQMAPTNDTIDNTTLLFMIDALEVSNKAGDRFYTSADTNGRQPSFQIAGENTCATVVDVACNDPQFSTLCSLVTTADLVDALNSQNPFPQKTVFAPTNDAFEKLPPDILTAVTDDTDTLINVLLYHVAPSILLSNDLACGLEIEMANSAPTTTLCGSNGMFYQADGGITSGLPKIVATDIETCYGVIHVIDEVLLPGVPDGENGENSTCISNETLSITDIACTNPEFSLLCGLVRQAGMGNLLTGGNHTVFAPSNDAFTEAMESMGQSVDLTDQGVVTNVLLQHIVWGSVVSSSDLSCDMSISMGNDGNNTIACEDDSFFVGGPSNGIDAFPRIVSADIGACNGVIHVINGVILPEFDVTVNDNITTGNETTTDQDPDMNAAMQQCSICGSRNVTIGDGTIAIPDGVYLPGLEDDIEQENREATCGFVEEQCQTGFCSEETCDKFDTDTTKEACGCGDEAIEI